MRKNWSDKINEFLKSQDNITPLYIVGSCYLKMISLTQTLNDCFIALNPFDFACYNQEKYIIIDNFEPNKIDDDDYFDIDFLSNLVNQRMPFSTASVKYGYSLFPEDRKVIFFSEYERGDKFCDQKVAPRIIYDWIML